MAAVKVAIFFLFIGLIGNRYDRANRWDRGETKYSKI